MAELILLTIWALFAVAGNSAAVYHKARTIFQYPQVGTWLENAAVRSNGDVLLTSVGNPGGLHSLNPFDGSAPVLVSNDFGARNATLGIVETVPDTFYVVASNFSTAPTSPGVQQGTNAIYKVVFQSRGSNAAEVSLLTRLPRAKTLNGLTKFNDTLLLLADYEGGRVFGVHTQTGKVSRVSHAFDLEPTASSGGGVNGVHFANDTLYFTNSGQVLLGKIDLDADAEQVGKPIYVAGPILQKGVFTAWDDFALDSTVEYAYAVSGNANNVRKISLNGNQVESIVAGNVNSTAIAEPTSAVFGRTERDKHVLYVVTAGGSLIPVQTASGPKQVGAQVVAVNLASK